MMRTMTTTTMTAAFRRRAWLKNCIASGWWACLQMISVAIQQGTVNSCLEQLDFWSFHTVETWFWSHLKQSWLSHEEQKTWKYPTSHKVVSGLTRQVGRRRFIVSRRGVNISILHRGSHVLHSHQGKGGYVRHSPQDHVLQTLIGGIAFTVSLHCFLLCCTGAPWRQMVRRLGDGGAAAAGPGGADDNALTDEQLVWFLNQAGKWSDTTPGAV